MINRDLHIDLKISVKPQKHTIFENSLKKVFMILGLGFYYSIMHEFNFVFM